MSEINPYFLVAAGLGAAFLYCCWAKTPELKSKQTDDFVADVTRFLGHYADPADTWSQPENLTVRTERIQELKSEPGPYGVERVYYTGPGNSKLVTYGRNYGSL